MSRTINLVGQAVVADDGSGTLNLRFGSGALPPIPPIPPLPPLPEGVTVIKPSGGDDRQAFLAAWDTLAPDQTLVVSGILRISDSILLRGAEKKVVADPRVLSGFRSTRQDPMTGAYCAMFHLKDTHHITLRGLDIDAAGLPSGGLYIENSTDDLFENCVAHDIGWRSSDPRPLGGIFGDNGTRMTVRGCRAERTGGVFEQDGCRGIWLRGQSGVLIEGCHTADTGHTGIILEGSDGAILGCSVQRSLTNGTGYKVIYRSQHPAGEVRFEGNACEDTIGGGLMLEDAWFALVDIAGNTWRRCGREGSSFGAIYANEAANVKFRSNTLEGCRSTGALIRTTRALFEQNHISGGPATLALEDSNRDISLVSSGDVSLGVNNSNVWVDGVQRA